MNRQELIEIPIEIVNQDVVKELFFINLEHPFIKL